MKVLLLSDINSEHTQKWALSLAASGIEIGIFSLNKSRTKWFENIERITILNDGIYNVSTISIFSKWKYILQVSKVKSIIKQFQPDIVHSHYASSYGLLGALSGFDNLVVSVWGTDVFNFPKKSTLHANLLSFILSKARTLTSTSFCMKEELMKYTKKDITVIHFGVNINVFTPKYYDLNADSLTIGNIKALEYDYGNHVLLQAFKIVNDKYPTKNLSLLFVGGGSQLEILKKEASILNISNKVHFAGKVPHSEVSQYHQKIDMFVSLTLVDESFGVSLIEAMSSGKAVIASNTPGFAEVIDSSENGIIIEKNSVNEAVDAMSWLIENPQEMINKGLASRKRVEENYNWEMNLKQMIELYSNLNKTN